MFGYKEPIRFIFDPSVVLESGPMFINEFDQFWLSPEPVRYILDPNGVPESGSMLINEFDQFRLSPDPVRFTLDSNVVQKSGHMFVNQLDGLHEYRRVITHTLHTLTQDLRSVELLESVANGLLESSDLAVTAQCNFAQLSGDEPNFCVPSLHMPHMFPPGFGSVREELFAYVVSIARFSRDVLQKKLLQCKRELRRTSAVIAIIEKAALSVVSFFCSVRWERRRWFLHHGARPPKQLVQAILSLFTGACSRSLIAY